MKSKDEIENLKLSWYSDPIWDIEKTEGFEEYHDELLAYRKECEKQWEIQRKKKHDQLASFCCPMSFKFVNINPDDRGMTWQNCLVEKCAWWNPECEKCSITVLANAEHAKTRAVYG